MNIKNYVLLFLDKNPEKQLSEKGKGLYTPGWYFILQSQKAFLSKGYTC